jgi:hypothetical protein
MESIDGAFLFLMTAALFVAAGLVGSGVAAETKAQLNAVKIRNAALIWVG